VSTSRRRRCRRSCRPMQQAQGMMRRRAVLDRIRPPGPDSDPRSDHQRGQQGRVFTHCVMTRPLSSTLNRLGNRVIPAASVAATEGMWKSATTLVAIWCDRDAYDPDIQEYSGLPCLPESRRRACCALTFRPRRRERTPTSQPYRVPMAPSLWPEIGAVFVHN
jgi:hypothetical protein